MKGISLKQIGRRILGKWSRGREGGRGGGSDRSEEEVKNGGKETSVWMQRRQEQ